MLMAAPGSYFADMGTWHLGVVMRILVMDLVRLPKSEPTHSQAMTPEVRSGPLETWA